MKTEGIIPAPESAHAIRVAIDEALKCKETGEWSFVIKDGAAHQRTRHSHGGWSFS